jgi:cytochrome P450
MGRVSRLSSQLLGRSPFAGTLVPARVPIFAPASGRPSLPFPHPWNFTRPLDILETFFWNADATEGPGRHNRYLEVPGFAPVLVTRDPRVIRAISQDTGEKPGQFDRDTLPSTGIARATGEDTLLFANGQAWKDQKKLAMPPFARTTLFQPERFGEFEATFRATVNQRLALVQARVAEHGEPLRVALEPEIKAIMLEMLLNSFFGAGVSYQEISERFVPALDCVIDHIVRDTVLSRVGVPLSRIPGWMSRGVREARTAAAAFEELTDRAMAGRQPGLGLWSQFKSEAPDAALRGNVRVFLAGALEATTSYASWALTHLARQPALQERVYEEIKDIESYTPEALASAKLLGRVLDETLRLTPSLYFHPRRATADTTVTTSAGGTLVIPRGTHILLDVWHANRHEDHWGISTTGFPAAEFAPARWEAIEAQGRNASDLLHFGFGHGPRFCPGKNLGQLEVALVVGGCIRLFRFAAARPEVSARAGVSTKPADGVTVDLYLRPAASPASPAPPAPPAGADAATAAAAGPEAPAAAGPKCPFHRPADR